MQDLATPDSRCEPGCATQDAAQLNASCFCAGPSAEALAGALQNNHAGPQVYELISERCPHLFAALPVFVSPAQAARMAQLIEAVEQVVALPAYQSAVLADAPAIARHDPGARGVFYGYDFHVGEDAVGLIEINTNAGGALLNAALARAGRGCSAIGDAGDGTARAQTLEDDIVAMFRNEWRLGGRSTPLRTIVIVDDEPENQYLYPEFLLFRQLFARHDIDALIVDPSMLRWEAGSLWRGDLIVDLVYNRLTDFMLDAPEHAALRDAYLANAVVLTPHPRAHALYADKRNLALLTDDARLIELGVPDETRAILLGAIPHTQLVRASEADRLWRTRRDWFFKPVAGYGGRAAYRGDKLTKRAWEDILGGDYVAQAIMAPPARTGGSAAAPDRLKFDIRSYTYDGAVQWTAARVYQGQTTNFRTPGGGFAMVYTAQS
ncbi:hypothetical protein [Massilia aquatica]|uniref:Circularly permuted type 2 ATP-grasp protein n=1 Tax=Massilia aquatica TaxID=2609000 RepID=A0ABX0M8Z9_9BURK|nr:hypothetical protein [Massilia aquatica]NHZ42789.1 hypothetical protein [Massilia aquatica]